MSDSDSVSVQRLSRDLVQASKTLSDMEARFLVDSYYQVQENRLRAAGQIRAMLKSKEPHQVLKWLEDQSSTLESQIRRALEKYVDGHPVGPWMQSIYGIGPVIAAGLLAHIDINKAPTVSHIWSFGGYNPSKKWEKGQKRPWNADLKVLFWKTGQSFMKFHNHEKCYYGHLYASKKRQLLEANERNTFEADAAAQLERYNFSKDSEAYKSYITGKLPPAHIDARARRYAVKLFLAHLHDVMYRRMLGKAPPAPYPIAHLDHAHYIAPPAIDSEQ